MVPAITEIMRSVRWVASVVGCIVYCSERLCALEGRIPVVQMVKRVDRSEVSGIIVPALNS